MFVISIADRDLTNKKHLGKSQRTVQLNLGLGGSGKLALKSWNMEEKTKPKTIVALNLKV